MLLKFLIIPCPILKLLFLPIPIRFLCFQAFIFLRRNSQNHCKFIRGASYAELQANFFYLRIESSLHAAVFSALLLIQGLVLIFVAQLQFFTIQLMCMRSYLTTDLR